MHLSINAGFCTLIFFHLLSFNSLVVFAQPDGSPPLEVGKPVERELKGGESHTYELKLGTGEFLKAVANQRGINLFVVLTGPYGEKLAEVGSPRGWRGAQTLLYVTPTSGTYKLGIVSPDKDAKAGSYKLTIAELRPGTSKDAAYVAGLNIYYETNTQMNQLLAKPPDERSAETFSSLTGMFEEALELFIKAENQEFEIHTLNLMALSHARFGNPSKAIEYWKQTLDINERMGKGVDLNQITNMGMAYKQMRNYAEAIRLYKRGYDKFEKAGNDHAKMVTLYILGNTYRDQGDPEAALEYYLSSLRLAEKMPDPTKFIQAWHETGSAYSNLGNYAKALEYQQKTLPMYESIGNKGGIASMFVNVGVTYEAQNNLELGLEYFQKALSAFEKIDKSEGGQGTALLGMSEIYRKRGDFDRALEHLKRALKLFEEMKWTQRVAETLDLIGRAHLDRGDNGKALNHFNKALEISESLPNKLVIAEILNDLANLYIQDGNYTAALDHAERTAEIADKTGTSGFLWQTHITKGKAYLGLKQYARAQQAFNKSIEIIEDLRLQTAGGDQEQQKFFQNKTVAYIESMRLLINEGKIDESFAVSERAKSRALLDVLQTGRAELSKTMTAQEKERERILRDGRIPQ
jgi:tetratricopeptide (TPR) repeat protein